MIKQPSTKSPHADIASPEISVQAIKSAHPRILATTAGKSFPLGPTLQKEGVNFSIFSKNARQVELLLFDTLDDIVPSIVIPLDPKKNHTYHYWHIFVPDLKATQLYAYRISGPNDPANGHRFDADKILLDPYAKAVAVPPGFDRSSFVAAGSTTTPSMKSVVSDLTDYDWENDQHPRHSYAHTVIYEMHVGGFTKHPNSGVAANKRGTFKGLIEKIPYLKELGITAVELLPVFQFDPQDSPKGLTNYWGYSPVSFFAPHQGYSTSVNPVTVIEEFRDMVKALHREDIEVILDVVFNHTAEGNEHGPTYSFRGIDNSNYYTLENDKSKYANYTGTGNTLNANHPIVRRMIIDSLHFWVKEMHVDGFRFDLASILSRDSKGHPIENPPVLWDIESDPVLAGTKLIAEAWDAAGLYQVGSFIGDSWKEWNGKFRDDVRSFFRGDNGVVSRFATRTMGSPDLFGHEEREPEQSVNFITCHDGFTLNDLVSYNSKHNEANNEDNRDGCHDNISWNGGVEGPTDYKAIEQLRTKQIKNFLTINLLSIGTPMILMGDEVRRTQQGNNNAYCQDNEISWFDWSLVNQHNDILRFTQQLIKARLNRDLASDRAFGLSLNQLLKQATITWHGITLNQPDWSDQSHSIALTVQSLSGDMTMHYMINAYTEPLEFALPDFGHRVWRRWIDTSLDSPNDIVNRENALQIPETTYVLSAHSLAICYTQKHLT